MTNKLKAPKECNHGNQTSTHQQVASGSISRQIIHTSITMQTNPSRKAADITPLQNPINCAQSWFECDL